MFIPPFHRVDEYALNDHGEVEMVAAGHAGRAGQADRGAPGHVLSRRDIDPAEVAV
jgi:hypothetical protein